MHRYQWNATKAHANRAKHGVDFADAVIALEDPLAITTPDPEALGEERWVTLGEDASGRLLVVVHATSVGVVRIVSARRATRRERSYES